MSQLHTASRKVMIKYVGPVLIYKIIDPHNSLLMTLDGKILRGLFEHERLKPAILRTSEGNVNNLSHLKQVINIGFVGLAFEGILIFLHNRRHKVLHIAVCALSTKTDIQRNKLRHLENTLVMYGVYNEEMVERLIKTVHALHTRQTLHKSLFAGRTSVAYEYYSQMHGE